MLHSHRMEFKDLRAEALKSLPRIDGRTREARQMKARAIAEINTAMSTLAEQERQTMFDSLVTIFRNASATIPLVYDPNFKAPR